jgi:cephalosporin-C deacetylase
MRDRAAEQQRESIGWMKLFKENLTWLVLLDSQRFRQGDQSRKRRFAPDRMGQELVDGMTHACGGSTKRATAGERAARMAIAGLERFKPNAYRPPDFLAFWERTAAETDATDPEVSVGKQEAAGPGVDLRRITFHSFGGARIHAYLARPRTGQPCPLIVHAHGYDDRYVIMTDWARRGVAVVGFDARGFGRSAAACAISEHGYVLTGIESPATSIVRGAVADYLQAIRVGRELLDGRAARVVCNGFSFGGALALMGAAHCPDASLLAVGQPTFGWNAERRRVALAGSTRQINTYLAPLLRMPVLVGIGLDDDVVPSRTVLAMVNHVRSPAEVRLLPVSHSRDPRESLWRDFHEEWLEYTVRGLPRDFGVGERQIQTLVA